MIVTDYPFRNVVRETGAFRHLTAEQRETLGSLEAHDAHNLVGLAVADRSFDLMWALRFTSRNTERLSAHQIGYQVASEPREDAERTLKFLRHYLDVAEAQLEARRSDEG